VDFDGTDVDLGHGSGAITLVNKGCKRCVDLAARFKPDDRAAAIMEAILG